MSKRVNWEAVGSNVKAFYDTQIAPHPERHQAFHNHYSSKIPNYYLPDTPDTIAEHTQATKRPSTSQGPQPQKVQALEADSSSQQSSSQGSSINPLANVQANYSQVSSTVPDTIEVDMGLPGTALGQGGAGDGNSNNTMPLYMAPKPHTMFGSKITTYKKVHRFITFGIANNWISEAATGPPAESQRYLSTALAEIPWHKPFLYMTQGEFDLLPAGSFVVEMRIRVVCRGVRIAFETAAADTTLATLNQIQNICIGHGLNKTGWGVNRFYDAFDATQTMKPTSVAVPTYAAYPTQFYGDPNVTIQNSIPNHQIGFKTPLYNYFTLVTKTQNFGGTPCIAEMIQYMDGKTAINQEVGEWKWKPRMGMLTAPLKHNRWGLPNLNGSVALVVPTNGIISQGHNQSIVGATASASGGTEVISEVDIQPANNVVSGDFSYLDDVDKSQFYRQGPWGQFKHPEIQPSVHIGIQAIPALTTSTFFTPVDKWTDAQCDWEVYAEMDVKEYQPTAFPYSTGANVPAGDAIYRTLTGTIYPDSENACTYAGLYPINSILN